VRRREACNAHGCCCRIIGFGIVFWIGFEQDAIILPIILPVILLSSCRHPAIILPTCHPAVILLSSCHHPADLSSCCHPADDPAVILR
jgi:hypothetical protein